MTPTDGKVLQARMILEKGCPCCGKPMRSQNHVTSQSISFGLVDEFGEERPPEAIFSNRLHYWYRCGAQVVLNVGEEGAFPKPGETHVNQACPTPLDTAMKEIFGA